ncbi:MAG: lactoylglutathione lyase [Alteromonas sp.]|nr:lactoylglutathione lyase [Alteromonas sp.]
MDVIDIKTFIPSKNYDISKAFYSEIGFNAEYVNEDLTLFENGYCLFFLQRFYNPELANNFMLQICVADIQDAFELCSRSLHKTKISSIERQHWGSVFYLWGPSGELLHITELGS